MDEIDPWCKKWIELSGFFIMVVCLLMGYNGVNPLWLTPVAIYNSIVYFVYRSSVFTELLQDGKFLLGIIITLLCSAITVVLLFYVGKGISMLFGLFFL